MPAPTGVYPDGLLRTGFDAVQRRLGGTFVEWEGWDWISDFGDPIAEHHTVREAVGIWDESPLRKWYFSGKDALAAVDHCFTSDMAALEVGQARYGAFLGEDGKMLGDGVVYRGDDETSIFVVTALDTDVLHFRRVTSQFDVEITEHTFEIPHLQVQGPRSRELLSGLTDEDVEGLKYFRFIPRPVTVAGVEGCYVVAYRLPRRARLRGVLPHRRRRPALAGAARPRRVHGHPAVRPGGRRSRFGSRPA